LTALAGETQPITLVDDVGLYTAQITTNPLDIEFTQDDGDCIYGLGTLSKMSVEKYNLVEVIYVVELPLVVVKSLLQIFRLIVLLVV